MGCFCGPSHWRVNLVAPTHFLRISLSRESTRSALNLVQHQLLSHFSCMRTRAQYLGLAPGEYSDELYSSSVSRLLRWDPYHPAIARLGLYSGPSYALPNYKKNMGLPCNEAMETKTSFKYKKEKDEPSTWQPSTNTPSPYLYYASKKSPVLHSSGPFRSHQTRMPSTNGLVHQVSEGSRTTEPLAQPGTYSYARQQHGTALPTLHEHEAQVRETHTSLLSSRDQIEARSGEFRHNSDRSSFKSNISRCPSSVAEIEKPYHPGCHTLHRSGSSPILHRAPLFGGDSPRSLLRQTHPGDVIEHPILPRHLNTIQSERGTSRVLPPIEAAMEHKRDSPLSVAKLVNPPLPETRAIQPRPEPSFPSMNQPVPNPDRLNMPNSTESSNESSIPSRASPRRIHRQEVLSRLQVKLVQRMQAKKYHSET